VSKENAVIANEIIESKILFLRDKKVILDKDLASLYMSKLEI
jgi:hypothetical protein